MQFFSLKTLALNQIASKKAFENDVCLSCLLHIFANINLTYVRTDTNSEGPDQSAPT